MEEATGSSPVLSTKKKEVPTQIAIGTSFFCSKVGCVHGFRGLAQFGLKTGIILECMSVNKRNISHLYVVIFKNVFNLMGGHVLFHAGKK